MSDIDEDEAMLLRQVASGSRSSAATTNPDDAESVTYENEEDEQEAMINDDCQHDNDREMEIGSRRTLPVVRNLMRQPHRSVKEAPLTRQLLTSERKWNFCVLFASFSCPISHTPSFSKNRPYINPPNKRQTLYPPPPNATP